MRQQSDYAKLKKGYSNNLPVRLCKTTLVFFTYYQDTYTSAIFSPDYWKIQKSNCSEHKEGTKAEN